MSRYIEISGAKVNNLKSVNLKILEGSLTCFMGPSGSGKTSLAFHTLYAESKRRFLNALPNYLKFFSERPAPVLVDKISPILPVFALAQSNPILNSRTQVCDLLGITEKISKLFHYLGVPTCPAHGVPLVAQSIEQKILSLIGVKQDVSREVFHFLIHKFDFENVWGHSMRPSRSYSKGIISDFSPDHEYFEILRVRGKDLGNIEGRIEEIFYSSGKKNEAQILIFNKSMGELKLSRDEERNCPHCDYSTKVQLGPESFGPTSAAGACSSCKGFGATLEYDRKKIVKNHHLSISDGAISVYRFSKFSRYLNSVKRDLKNSAISVDVPFNKLPEKVWDLLEKGGKSWPGLSDVFEYFESKKYKKSVRIMMRGLQSEVSCTDCLGSRLNRQVRYFRIKGFESGPTLNEIYFSSIVDLKVWSKCFIIPAKNSMAQKQASDIHKSINIAIDLGLGHLQLSRRAKTLSPGEYQRLLLVKYFCYEDSGSLFVFDEPGLGLGRNEQIIIAKQLRSLCDQGNTVVMIEHSPTLQSLSDEVVEFGPGAGHRGGLIVYQGPYRPLKIITSGIQKSLIEKETSEIKIKSLSVMDFKFSNLKVKKNTINLVVGPSGSGKSMAFVHGFGNLVCENIKVPPLSEYEAVASDGIRGLEGIDAVEFFSTQFSRTSSRSTVGSQTGLGSLVRSILAKSPLAKSMGLQDGHFSFNSELGQCPECEGSGKKIVEMQFLEDVVMECELCHGMRLNPLYGNLLFEDMQINNIFNSPIEQIIEHFKLTPKYRRIFDLLKLMGLGYLSLNRDLGSLSGGEKQRMALLAKFGSKIENHLLIIENLSFGLSESELVPILGFLDDQANFENTIILIDQSDFWREKGLNEIHMLKHISSSPTVGQNPDDFTQVL